MLTETSVYSMNEATYSRIALAHNKGGCFTEILSTVLKLDMYFQGHKITIDQILQFLRACSRCFLQCDYFVTQGYGRSGYSRKVWSYGYLYEQVESSVGLS